MFQCCFQGAISGLTSAVSSEAEESSQKANKHLDKLSGQKEEKDEFDNAIDKVVSTGNNILFNSKTTMDQHKREQVRNKNKKEMDKIRNKYQAKPEVKQMSKSDRQSYADVKARLSSKP